MTGHVTAAQAGRIRDAARITWLGGVLGILSFLASFVWDPAIFGFAAWPLGFALLVFTFTPLFRTAGDGPAILLIVVGVMGVVIELIGLFLPPPGTAYRIGQVFGAGTVLIGAWFVGAGAMVGRLGVFTVDVGPKAIRGGIGLGVIGVSWFIEDVTVSLVLLLGSLFLLNGIDPLLRQARRLGLPPATPGPTDAVSDGPTEATEPAAP